MKMIIYLTLSILCSTFLFSIEFEEIHEGGWGEGMSLSKPAAIDIDNDGLLDVIVGNIRGNLFHYEQESSNPERCHLVSRNFNDIMVGLSASPTFTDFNNDGLIDLIIGSNDGTLKWYAQSKPSSYEFTLASKNFNNLSTRSNMYPSFTDIDNDGLLDLIIGNRQNKYEILVIYEQKSPSSEIFSLIDDNFFNVECDYNIIPFFGDLDNDGSLDLIIGGQQSKLSHYEQLVIGSVDFLLKTDNFVELAFAFAAPFLIDVNQDGILDMICGNQRNSPILLIGSKSGFGDVITDAFEGNDIGSVSTPFVTDINNDDLLDLIIGNVAGNINLYKQEEKGSNFFHLSNSNLVDFKNPFYELMPCLIDFDHNGLLDLIVGESSGHLIHYEQNHVDPYKFDLVTYTFNDINVQMAAKPVFTDIDNDGLFDLIIANPVNLYLFEQEKNNLANFRFVTDDFSKIGKLERPMPTFTDIDNDGLLDLFINTSSNKLSHYEQTEPNLYDFSLVTNEFNDIILESKVLFPHFADINNDGLDDLLIGELGGGVHYFQRVSGLKKKIIRMIIIYLLITVFIIVIFLILLGLMYPKRIKNKLFKIQFKK